MTIKNRETLLGELFAGSILVKSLKIVAFIVALVALGFGIAVLADAREGFGYRGFLAYGGLGLVAGTVIFELAEAIRWLQKLHDRFDLYDKKTK